MIGAFRRTGTPWAPGGVFFAALLWMCAADSVLAQVQVGISFKRNLYMRYEPIICTVSITNRTGSNLLLRDTPAAKWFSIQVETISGTPIQPLGAQYSNEPLEIDSGQTARRSVNITPLFPIGEFGSYRVRAAVYVAGLDKYFGSAPLAIEITEGRMLWEETVGVPPDAGLDGRTRTYSLLTHRLPSSTMLYLRVQDRDRGVIYCTTQLGRFLSYGTPDVILDRDNQIHILHAMAPKQFLYSHFDLNGRVQLQQAYQDWGKPPVLVRTTDGGARVMGGSLYDPRATPPERELPGLGEKPVPLPAPGATPTPTPEGEEARPDNLLSR
jgi:hypothetical protein